MTPTNNKRRLINRDGTIRYGKDKTTINQEFINKNSGLSRPHSTLSSRSNISFSKTDSNFNNSSKDNLNEQKERKNYEDPIMQIKAIDNEKLDYLNDSKTEIKERKNLNTIQNIDSINNESLKENLINSNSNS